MLRVKIEFTLPMNPEPRARARIVGHRAWTPGKDEFEREFWALLSRDARKANLTRATLVVRFYRRGRAADLDNILKATIDALVTCGVLRGDTLEHLWRIDAEGFCAPDEKRPRIELVIEGQPAS